MVLVRADEVTIADLTIDGDNPALTSGVAVRGADVDARNGIETDTGGPFNGLEVRNVTVKNVYLRAIDASSGGTFCVEQSRDRQRLERRPGGRHLRRRRRGSD